MLLVLYSYHRLRPKWFSTLWYVRCKPCTYLALRLTLSLNRLKQSLTWSTPPRSTIWCAQSDFRAFGTFGANLAPILRLDQHYLQTDWNELPLDTHHLGVPLGVPKMISMPLVHSMQIVHLSCVEINTISERTKTSFHLTDVILEFNRVCPTWFLCPWYIRCTPCTYLATRLTLSKQTETIFTWSTPPKSIIWCAQKRF
jgi:hypothetical protein